MKALRSLSHYFTKIEWILWGTSVLLILISFLLFDRGSWLTLSASLIGVTSLIFCAKGNPWGQILMILFSLLYGAISFSFSYYGEMLTYLGMTLPMAVFALISWLRHPYEGNRSEVQVDHLRRYEWLFLCALTLAVTVGFYFLLRALNTANLLPSTISVTTSFAAAYLTFRRNPCYALGYAANDVVLIVLWVLASMEDLSYLSVVICFIMFLFNDLYAYRNWERMEKRQRSSNPK